MSVYVGSARIDERGKASGGRVGDQTGKEVAYQTYYVHSKGWYVLRAKNASHRSRIAYAMKAACDNNKIGYDQTNRNGLYNAVKSKGFDPAKCTTATETDCSGLVRVCVSYATGKYIPDFNTSSELSVLKGTGLFDVYKDSAHCASSAHLMNGDILVTKTKGHTVVVISGATGSSSGSSSSGSSSSSSVLKKGSKGEAVKTLQRNLNAAIGAGLTVDGSFGPACYEAVKKFQSKYGLTADGIAGPATQRKLASVLANKSSSSGSSSSVLKKGSKGEAVKTLQRNLNAAIGAGLAVDGSFGPACYTAVRKFQLRYGLSVDGIAGPATQKKLASVIANRRNVVVATPTLRKGSRGENVKTLQRNLNAAIGAGLSVDGVFGPSCYRAVKAFQSRHGLGADGVYGPNTAAKMKAVL
jgi:peptidoglycan hydrolase-like protein with peptidoglycan-binding domain